MHFRKIAFVMVLICLFPVIGIAQEKKEEKFEQSFRAFSVAMGAGVAGVLDINITRWSTPEERQALVNSLIQDGQEKMVDLLRKQKETGFIRTQSGAGMRGWPSVRLHYAYEFPKPDGKRTVILVTDRNIGMAEAMRNDRSTEYEISALVMELQKKEDGKEEGTGTLYLATKLGFDKEKKQLEVESLGQQPIRLTDIKREK